ncbi:MAG: hybrid sensor histidine kinase/response regulator [Spirochaetota bacterium]
MADSLDYQELFAAAPDAMFVMEAGGVVVAVNAETTRFLGYPREEILGRSVGEFVAPEQLDESSRRTAGLADVETLAPARRVFVRRDGTRVPGEIYVSAFVSRATGRRLIYSIVRDISRSLAVDRLHAEQSVRFQALGALAGGVAHDFNNILASIIGFGELAREQLENDLPAARDIDRALKAAEQARKLTAQILAFGREDDDVWQPVDLEQAIVGIIRLVRSTLSPGTDLRFESDHSPAIVLGDRTRLQQAVINLCSNAGKAVGDRGGLVAIRLESIELEPGNDWSLPAGGYASLTVEDDGPGVPDEVHDFIFDPYFSTRPGAGGTGLGLSVVKSVVVGHGGAIRLEADAPGARFRTMIPLHRSVEDPVEERAEETGVSESSDSIGRTVLVLDDDPEVVEVMSRGLSAAGFSVMASTDPRDALQLCGTWASDIDLVLTDENMPEMAGTAFLRRARRDGLRCPAVVLTGLDPELGEAERSELGIVAVVHKPVRRTLLQRVARRAIDEWEL